MNRQFRAQLAEILETFDTLSQDADYSTSKYSSIVARSVSNVSAQPDSPLV